MATRMQQRRGTATQWTTANPVLAAGEIGYEIDTNKFKIGDGINQWSSLDYFASSDAIADLIDGAPDLLNTLNELANAIGDDPQFAQTVSNHVNATTNVHGIANTLVLATQTDVSSAVSNHNALTANVHGIADTTVLATLTHLQVIRSNAIAESEAYSNSLVSTHNLATTNVHGIANTLQLATINQLDTHTGSTNVHGIANTLQLATQDYVINAVANATVNQSSLAGTGIDWNSVDNRFDIDSTVATTSHVSNSVSAHSALTENIHGIANTLALATQTDVNNAQTAAQSAASSALSSHNSATANVHGIADTTALATKSYADSAVSTHNSVTTNVHGIANTAALITNSGNQTIDGTLTLSGLIVNGNTTTVSTVDLTVQDPMINLSSEQYDTDLVDIGIHGSYGTTGGNATSHSHTGLVRDVTDGKWKLFSNAPVPVGNEINFTSATYDTLKVGTVEPTVGVAFSDGTQTKEGVPSRTTIVQATGAYNLSTGGLSLRDSLIEVDHTGGSAVNVTIPADSTTNYPIGTSIDVVRTNTGAVTIAGAGGVTVNATPGLNLRARWSSVTLFKRAANTWLVMGDLSA